MAKSRLNDITYDQMQATVSKNPAPPLLIADNSLSQENESRKKSSFVEIFSVISA